MAAADIVVSKSLVSGVSAAHNDSTVLTERKLFVKRKQRAWSQSLFEVQDYYFVSGSLSVSALPLGLAEARVSIAARMLTAGVKLNFDIGYEDLLKKLKSASGSALAEIIRSSSDNFVFTLDAGSMALIPSGFIVLHFAVELCRGFRWGLFPRHEGEHRRVLKTVSSVVDAFPSMNAGTYQQIACSPHGGSSQPPRQHRRI